MTKLSVNINKIALLRNSRGGKIPDVIQFAKDCERFGADGITVHPRVDERHIKYNDVFALSEVVSTEFNIEGYPDKRFLHLIKNIKPAQATLVPDAPAALTSNNGWDVLNNLNFLKSVIDEIKKAGVRVSLFLNPHIEQVHAAKQAGTDRIELYTGPYAEHFSIDKNIAIKKYTEAAGVAEKINLGINAGHDLNLDNLKFFRQNIPPLQEVSIGHALVSDALYYGIENTIQLYKRQL